MGVYEITSGVKSKPIKCCCYGAEGVGKTTFASMWPGAVFIDIEDGSGHYDVARMPRPDTWAMLLDELMAIAAKSEVGTVVIDTADAAESLCIAEVLKRSKCTSIEQVGGGYGKGYTMLAEEFGKLTKSLDRIIEAGKNVVILAHAQIRKFEQPDELGAYDRWELKLQKKCAPIIKEWCDLLLFANYETDLMTSKDGKKVKAKGGKKRVMYASHSASWDAKNRLGLPDSMPFDFDQIADNVPEFASGGVVEGPTIAQTDEPAKPAKPAEKPEPTEKDAGQPKPAAKGREPTLEQMQEYVAEIAKGNMDAKPPVLEEVTPPEVAQLNQLMADSGVNAAQLRTVVGEMKNNPYEIETPIADYSMKFVGNLLKHWEQIAEKALAVSDIYGDDIPF